MRPDAKQLTGVKGTDFIDRCISHVFAAAPEAQCLLAPRFSVGKADSIWELRSPVGTVQDIFCTGINSPYIHPPKPARALPYAEKCQRSSKKRQGTTSVVPKMQQIKRRALAPEGCFSGFSSRTSSYFAVYSAILLLLLNAPLLCAQTAPASQAAATDAAPIAIVALDSKNPDAAAKVTGALEVSQGRAVIAASGTITSGSQTTEVVLPHRGVLRVCASTTVKLAADSSVPAGETPGLMLAMDQGALEMSFAMSFATSAAAGRNADVLMTPDFRILIGGPGAAEIKVRLGQHGDTCVDNAGITAPYVLVTSVFDGGNYHVQPGQRVMFEHGSLREVVDNEKEPCGCPPPLHPGTNEFPVAQSAGLAPLPKPAPNAVSITSAPPEALEPLVYNSADHAAKPAAEATPAPSAAATKPAAKKKSGFFGGIGKFFRRLFGAE
jgi:hypothetical protein